MDENADHSPLWGRYESVLAALVQAEVEANELGRELMMDFRQEMRTREQAEHYRAERYRVAQVAGDEVEMRRWERLVPVGCLEGRHRFHTWPAGACCCIDCGLDGEAVA